MCALRPPVTRDRLGQEAERRRHRRSANTPARDDLRAEHDDGVGAKVAHCGDIASASAPSRNSTNACARAPRAPPARTLRSRSAGRRTPGAAARRGGGARYGRSARENTSVTARRVRSTPPWPTGKSASRATPSPRSASSTTCATPPPRRCAPAPRSGSTSAAGPGVAAADALATRSFRGRAVLVDADRRRARRGGRDGAAARWAPCEADLADEAGVAAVRDALEAGPRRRRHLLRGHRAPAHLRPVLER